jgi:serine/threonine protein kinase
MAPSAQCGVCGAALGPQGCPRGHLEAATTPERPALVRAAAGADALDFLTVPAHPESSPPDLGADPLDALTVPAGRTLASPDAGTEPSAPLPTSEARTRVVADPLLPDVLGAFRLDYVAGTGGMGTVYRGHHEGTGAAVAIKVMKRTAMRDPHVLERALREVTAARLIRHPGVAPLLDQGHLPDGRPWLATPFYEGASLELLLGQRRVLPWPLVVPVLAQVARILTAAHQAGVVHRDVKPANIFCAREQGGVTVKLLDFGLALLGDVAEGVPPTSVESAAGTPDFLSPEQALGRNLDARADLYALGITAFQVLTGRLPFTDRSDTGVMRRHLFEAPPRLSDEASVPRALDALVASLLAKQPAQRPDSGEVVAARLERLRFLAPEGDGLLEDLARAWAREHPPSLWTRLLGRRLS